MSDEEDGIKTWRAREVKWTNHKYSLFFFSADVSLAIKNKLAAFCPHCYLWWGPINTTLLSSFSLQLRKPHAFLDMLFFTQIYPNT